MMALPRGWKGLTTCTADATQYTGVDGQRSRSARSARWGVIAAWKRCIPTRICWWCYYASNDHLLTLDIHVLSAGESYTPALKRIIGECTVYHRHIGYILFIDIVHIETSEELWYNFDTFIQLLHKILHTSYPFN